MIKYVFLCCVCHGCVCSEQQQAGAHGDSGVEEGALEGEFLGSFFQRVSFPPMIMCVDVCAFVYTLYMRGN